ncbi:MAG: hypothetical protein ABIF71_15775 [Planctomycetota bacterium]
MIGLLTSLLPCLFLLLAMALAVQAQTPPPLKPSFAPAQKLYMAQLIAGPDLPVTDRIVMPGLTIATRITEKGSLEFRVGEEGSYKRLLRPDPVGFAMRSPEGRKQTVQILFRRHPDGS